MTVRYGIRDIDHAQQRLELFGCKGKSDHKDIVQHFGNLNKTAMLTYMKLIGSLALIALILAAYGYYFRAHRYDVKGAIPEASPGVSEAYFAGGCFWCTEADFEKLPGVSEVISGYAGGHLTDPTYPEVVKETTGHRETILVRYDPTEVTYQELVEYFFSHIDPTDPQGSFVDRGESYTSAIFYSSETEKQIAEEEITRLNASGVYDRPVATMLVPFVKFWPAEEYHQDYYKKNPLRYEYYRDRSGRNEYVEKTCALRDAKGVPCIQGVVGRL